jgi:Protein of unknown function (DUF2637)
MTIEHNSDPHSLRADRSEVGVTGRLIRITTALAVAAVAAVAAVISYRHAYELVSTHGETGATARLVPFTVDGLILAAGCSSLTPAAATGPYHPSTLTQTATPAGHERKTAPMIQHHASPVPTGAPAVEETVRTWHTAGRSQRAIARELGIDRRKIKRILDHPTQPHSPSTTVTNDPR